LEVCRYSSSLQGFNADKMVFNCAGVLSKLNLSDPLTTKTNVFANPNAFLPVVVSQRFMSPLRRKKMKKHKRRKRFNRDWFIYQKYHVKKKAKAENLFRQRMRALMHDLDTFDALAHVKETIQKAKREWQPSVAVSGRKKHPHWSELMTVEELYGVKPDTHIDKKAGQPSEEDAAKIAQLRSEYFAKYVRKGSSSPEK